jgi:hypothetical protein
VSWRIYVNYCAVIPKGIKMRARKINLTSHKREKRRAEVARIGEAEEQKGTSAGEF